MDKMEKCKESPIQDDCKVLIMNKHFTEYPFNFVCPNCKASLHTSILERCESLNAFRKWENYVNVKCQKCSHEHTFHVHWTPYLVSDDSNTLDILEEEK